jgi:hypothetical protein
LPSIRELLRLFTVWQMKDRAKVIGAQGAGGLLAELVQARDVRLHLLGHSYGCQVLLAGLCSDHFPSDKQVDSALLLQPAISAYCFAPKVPKTAKPGRYRPALQRVRQPIAVTHSTRDAPLYRFYHLAVNRYGDSGDRRPAAAGIPDYAALGGYGPQGCGAECQAGLLLPPTENYPAVGKEVRILGFNGTAHIPGHSDVATPAVYWRLYWQVVRERV